MHGLGFCKFVVTEPLPCVPVLLFQLRALSEPQPRPQDAGLPQAEAPQGKGDVPGDSEPRTPAPSSEAAVDSKRQGDKGKCSLVITFKPPLEPHSNKKHRSSACHPLCTSPPRAQCCWGWAGRGPAGGSECPWAPGVGAAGLVLHLPDVSSFELIALSFGSRVENVQAAALFGTRMGLWL